MVTPVEDHPAKFSAEVIAEFERIIKAEWLRQVALRGRQVKLTLLDPFAGIGGIHVLQNILGHNRLETFGIELEEEWAINHERTWVGDSTTMRLQTTDGNDPQHAQRRLRKNAFDIVGTSYVYGNRMSDHHDPTDDSKRFGYKFSLGHDLTPGNAGELYFWQDAYKALHTQVWLQCDRLLKPGGIVILNGSDFSRTVYWTKDKVKHSERVWYQVAAWHRNVWEQMGYVVEGFYPIKTKRMKNGANRDFRADFETIYVLRKLPADVAMA